MFNPQKTEASVPRKDNCLTVGVGYSVENRLMSVFPKDSINYIQIRFDTH